jgi:hypothetical protein
MVPPMVKSRPEDVLQKTGQALGCEMSESEIARLLSVNPSEQALRENRSLARVSRAEEGARR